MTNRTRIATITHSALAHTTEEHLRELLDQCDGHNAPEGFTEAEIRAELARREAAK